MTGQELKRLYMSLGWTASKAAQELDIARDTLYALHKREEVDKRTEYAMRWLKFIQDANQMVSKGDSITFSRNGVPIKEFYDFEGRN